MPQDGAPSVQQREHPCRVRHVRPGRHRDGANRCGRHAGRCLPRFAGLGTNPAASASRRARSSGRTVKRIAVVGGGVVGAAIAWRLVGKGAGVTVIDPGDTASGASPGSLAWLNVSSARDEAYAGFRARSLRLWQQIADQPGCPATLSGSFLWGSRYGDLASRAARLSDLGWPARILTRAEFAERQPWTLAAPEAVLHLPGEGVADPRHIGHWFLEQARAMGAAVIRGRVQSLEEGVRLSDGTQIPADAVVVAAGTATAGLVASLGAILHVQQLPGLLVRTRPAPPLANGYVDADNVHFWQDSEGTILAGADYSDSGTSGSPERAAAGILRKLERLYAAPARLSIDEILIRERPVPADGFPIVGRLPSAPGTYVAVTHSGMTLAPLIGELAAEELLSERLQPLLFAYRPR